MIKINNLSFSYTKNNPVLRDISLEIGNNECVILFGPNGVGKSTLIGCLLGSNKYKEGEIYFDSKLQKDLSSKGKADYLAYVPQLINGTNLTVEETLLLGRLPYYRLYPSKEDYQKVNEIIERFSLKNIKYKCTNQISGGERQKVNIARALVQESKVIIFDEPTSNLDIKAQLEVLSMIEDSKKNHSFLISMHDINEALSIGDKFVFLKDGEIKRVCNIEDVDEALLDDIYGIKSTLVSTKKGKYFIYEN